MFNTSHFNTTLSAMYFDTFSIMDIPIYPTLVNVNLNGGAYINIRQFFNPQLIYLNNLYLYNRHNTNLNLDSYSLINMQIYPKLGNLNLNTDSKLYITRFFNPKLLYIDSRNHYNNGYNSPNSVTLLTNSELYTPIYPTLGNINLNSYSLINIPFYLTITNINLILNTNSIFNLDFYTNGTTITPSSGIPYLNVLFEANLPTSAYPKLWQILSTDMATNWVTISKETSFDKLFKYSGEFYYRAIDNFGRIWTGENLIVINELTADFSADNTYNVYPLTVQFTADTNGRDYDGTQYIWEWAHEDDSGNWVEFSRDIDPEYTFEVSGKYSIRFTVISPGGENMVQIIKENYIEARFMHDIAIEYVWWNV